MSGGVLTLRHDEERAVEVEAVEGAPWEAGIWEGEDDEAAYGRVRGVMQAYHAARRDGPVQAPVVTVRGPMLPAADPELFGLPPEVAVEFADLPGLKSALDRTNLAVIQREVSRAFCVVALDYWQTDEEHREKLLAELKDVVEFLGGQTDTLLFVLNRVDTRGGDDEPLSDRVNGLRQEIQGVLGLESAPDLLPFEGRLLYYAQCAWGAAPTDGAPIMPANARTLLGDLRRDCATSIIDMLDNSPGIEPVWRRLEGSLRSGEDIATEDLRTFVEAVWEHSGGRVLRDRMRERVTESLPELVLAPALHRVIREGEALVGSLRPLIRLQKQKSKEALELERDRLNAAGEQLRTAIEDARARFRDLLNGAVADLKSRDQTRRAQLTESLGAGFEPLLSAVNAVTGDLTARMIQPVRKSLERRTPAHDVQDTLGDVVPPSSAEEVARGYGGLVVKLSEMTRSEGCYELKVRKGEEGALQKLNDAERAARKLYQAMRDAMTVRAERQLQKHADQLLGALDGLVRVQADAVEALCASSLPDADYAAAIAAVREAAASERSVSLPERFFTLDDGVQREDMTESVVVGHETKEWTTGSCFKKHHSKQVAVKEDQRFEYLRLEDEGGMAKQWSGGIQQGEDALWDTLGEWMQEALDASAKDFSTAVSRVIQMAKSFVERQIDRAERDHRNREAFWKNVELDTESAGDHIRFLSREARGSLEAEVLAEAPAEA